MDPAQLIVVRCSSCHARLRARPESVGTRGKCPKCGRMTTVELPPPQAAPDEAPRKAAPAPKSAESPAPPPAPEEAPRESVPAPTPSVELPPPAPAPEEPPRQTSPAPKPSVEYNGAFSAGTNATRAIAVDQGIIKPSDKVGMGILSVDVAPVGEVTLKGSVSCGACTVPGFTRGPELPFEARTDWNVAGSLAEVECPKCGTRMSVFKSARELNGKSALFLCVSRLKEPASPAFGASPTDPVTVHSVDGQPVRRD